jgi:N-acetylneuraminate synthase
MSDWDEIDGAVDVVSRNPDRPFAVLQCTSAYPTLPEDIGLNVLAEINRRYECASGLSDHSGTIYPSLGAVALGARVVEVHVTLSPQMFGPDVPASVTPAELRELCEGARYIGAALAAPVDKAAAAERLSSTRELFTKSIVARGDLEAGTVLSEENLTVKKPAGGLPPASLPSVVGRRLRVPLDADASLLEEHLEPAADAS